MEGLNEKDASPEGDTDNFTKTIVVPEYFRLPIFAFEPGKKRSFCLPVRIYMDYPRMSKKDARMPIKDLVEIVDK